MEREREKKPWREVDRGRDRSQHNRQDPRAAERRQDEVARSRAETREVRSALEALFAPKVEESAQPETARSAPRMVLPASPSSDPRTTERRRLLGKLLSASGPAAISKIADEFVSAGFTFPEDQDVHLQLLEHLDEVRVRDSVDALSKILAGELPKRKHVLDQRLRRIEEHGEDDATRSAAGLLRKLIHGRPTTPQPGRVR